MAQYMNNNCRTNEHMIIEHDKLIHSIELIDSINQDEIVRAVLGAQW